MEIKTEKDKVKKRLEEVKRQNAPMQKRLDEVTKKVRELENSTRELVSAATCSVVSQSVFACVMQFQCCLNSTSASLSSFFYAPGKDRHEPVKRPNHSPCTCSRTKREAKVCFE